MGSTKSYLKGIGISTLLLFWAIPLAPAVLRDVRVWLLFALGTVLVGSHPPMKFSAMGLAERTAEDRYSALFLTVAVYVSFLPLYVHYVLLLRQHASPAPWTWSQILAAVVAVGGIGLRMAAIRKLGRWFTTAVVTRAEQELVDSGLYRWIRHPSYTGALLFWGSPPFLFGAWPWAFFTVPVLVAAYLWRIRAEERALTEHFGERYLRYQRETKRLIPFLF